MSRCRSILTFTLLASACVTVSKSVLTEQYMSTPVPREGVAVLMASVGDSLPRDCVRVAVLHASGDQDYTDEGDVLNKLRDEAGKLGANTVFLQNMEDAGTGERVVGALFGTNSDRDADALALHCDAG
jgi:hypothetical protein